MIGYRCQDRAQVERWIEPVQPGCSDEAIKRRGSLAAGIGSHEEIVLVADGDGAQCPFGSVVVNLQQPVVNVAFERTPVRERITDRDRGFAVGRKSVKHLLHPEAQLIEQRPGPCPADRTEQLGGLGADLILNSVQRSDASSQFDEVAASARTI